MSGKNRDKRQGYLERLKTSMARAPKRLPNYEPSLEELFSTGTVGDRLRWFRKATGLLDRGKPLSQLEIGTLTGISRQAWNNYEHERSRISYDEAIKLRTRYGLSFEWIYFGDPWRMAAALQQKMFELALEEWRAKNNPAPRRRSVSSLAGR